MKLDPRDGATAKGASVRYVVQLVKAARAAGHWNDAGRTGFGSTGGRFLSPRAASL